MYAKKLIIQLLCIPLLIFTNSIVFAETCNSGSGTSCSMSCSEGTLTLVCNKSEETCSGSCSKSKDKESAAFNLIADIYVATGRRLPIDLILGKLRDAPMGIEGSKYNLTLDNFTIEVIIKTDFIDFYRPDWNNVVSAAAERIKRQIGQ